MSVCVCVECENVDKVIAAQRSACQGKEFTQARVHGGDIVTLIL